MALIVVLMVALFMWAGPAGHMGHFAAGAQVHQHDEMPTAGHGAHEHGADQPSKEAP